MDIDGEGASSAPRLRIFISSAAQNANRRQALRKSWFRYLADPSIQSSVSVCFVLSKDSESEELAQEQAQHGDLVLVNAPPGYHNLWRKALVFLAWLEERSSSGGGSDSYDFVMHADDDSFLRLDLLVPLMAGWPRQRFYWGYIWDGTGNRVTAPIRNPANKSHMPQEQYPLDYYPPFASGCGFVLSRDLVRALLAQPLPDYRLLDPPFGIHLCGPPELCVLPDGPVTPLHDDRVRPYRPLPTFRPDTLVQHYLRPEEMRPFYQQALEAASGDAAPAAGPSSQQDTSSSSAPAELYNTLVSLGLLRR
ncbi:hypothetical protein Agub_g4697 [Astrephomene gubernaculifera]|uniref:Hexosyltransferase n=1 Tax=Astrephomene gubernaculifera TaxID=47775 RepID=A0AAD3DKN4_9CHLO|nr:hypothetical protein Agub_g4697 [Astrephomene gubernaculifera]